LNFQTLTNKNIRFFARYYKLVSLAVVIMVAVITGSLVVGDSVRATLVRRVSERLGNTETIIFSRNSFIDKKILDTPLFEKSARGILLTNGFISCSGKLIPVFVWGVDDMSVTKGTARINPALAKELAINHPDDIVLRLPATGMVPSGSLFVTENYTTSLRLSCNGIVETDEGGNLSMKNEQVIPFNIFVNRDELAETLKTEGKINLILANNHIPSSDLENIWDYGYSGMSAKPEDEFAEIVSDRVFLQKEVVETIIRNNSNANRLFSYMANSIEHGDISIPYSFVTAMDAYRDEALPKDGIILSDYSADRIHARVGDTIHLSYFVSEDLKTLSTGVLQFRVCKIVPLADFLNDRTLSADFPGLSDVERCTDWDSDLPIDMNMITAEDEEYWEQYRNTPKAIIPYEAVCGDWGNAYGNATAIRVEGRNPDFSGLTPEMFGIQLIYPREAGLYAARNGVDFSGLFLALGFFIIISAILLMMVPLSEMLYKRKRETELLQSLGFNRKRIIRMLWTESAPIVLLSSIAGVIAGLLYTALIMWLLGSVWKGATQTDGFSVYPGTFTLLAGLVAGTGLSLWVLRITITRSLKGKRHKAGQTALSLRVKKTWAVISGILAIFIIILNFFILRSVTLFVVAGVVLITVAALWGDYLLCRNGLMRTDAFHSRKMIWATLFAGRKQAVLSFFALATGVFIVFSVGLNRKGFSDSIQIRTGTGGYSLWCENSIPVYHNMSTRAGREKLSLTSLPSGTEILQCLRYGADDASCLNLNKVIRPTVLGVDMQSLSASDFRIEQNLYRMNREDFFARMQMSGDSVYPALVDATVLAWSLGMSLGDTLYYEGDKGQPVRIQLAGILSNSVFQGHIIIDRTLFSEIWEEITGSEVFLLKVDEPEKEEVKTLLSQALNEYGVRVSTTNERLKQFNIVTDTYLSIFLTLGGLGLLLGVMSFVIVVRKNLAMRQDEIELYRTLGFPDSKIERTLYKENVIVPLYAIITGVAGSLAGVSISFMNTGIWIWLMALVFAILLTVCAAFFVKKSVRNEIQNPGLQKI
jgi:putative ABC transport system permease protein